MPKDRPPPAIEGHHQQQKPRNSLLKSSESINKKSLHNKNSGPSTSSMMTSMKVNVSQGTNLYEKFLLSELLEKENDRLESMDNLIN